MSPAQLLRIYNIVLNHRSTFGNGTDPTQSVTGDPPAQRSNLLLLLGTRCALSVKSPHTRLVSKMSVG